MHQDTPPGIHVSLPFVCRKDVETMLQAIKNVNFYHKEQRSKTDWKFGLVVTNGALKQLIHLFK